MVLAHVEGDARPGLFPTRPPGHRAGAMPTPGVADRRPILCDVVTGPVGQESTTDDRLAFRCPERSHGPDKPEFQVRYRRLRLDVIRAVLRGETFVTLD